MGGYYGMNPPWGAGPGPHPHQPMGHWPQPPPAHGFCAACCHPVQECVCGCRECRKESKELLVRPEQAVGKEGLAYLSVLYNLAHGVGISAAQGDAVEDDAKTVGGRNLQMAQAMGGAGTAFIGGGCCVHLSAEYTAQNEQSAVLVFVADAEQTILSWMKYLMDPGYYVKECIITTNPGATLAVYVVNTIARIRWCEVFSC